jgi:predicted outer membrane repeat protein
VGRFVANCRRAAGVLRASTPWVAVVALAVLVVGSEPARADTITVDTTADSVAGGDGVTSLREAFIQASTNAVDDTIVLAAGATYDLTSCLAGELEHSAAGSLTIEGNGATIHQTCSDLRVISSPAPTSSLTVNDVTIQGGPNTGVPVDGAGVLVDGSLVLNDSTVTNVDSGGRSVLETGFGAGFAITVTNSEIVGNDGNGIRTQFAGVSVTGSTISNNTGGGIALVDGNPLHVVDSTIANNSGRGASTTGQGSTKMVVSGSTISGNGGGGISCSGCSQLTVAETNILDNGAVASDGAGGGVNFAFDYEPVPVAPFVTITESAIDGNTARRFGGGVAVSTLQAASDPMTSPVISISSSSIAGNTTVGDARHGGGVAMLTGSLALTGSTVSDNVAGSGGVVQAAGGGVYFQEDVDDGIADPHDLILNGVTFALNEATGRGGGAAISTGGIVEVHGSEFLDNVSSTLGGGASVEAAFAGMDTSRFEGNEALRGGGLFAGDFGPNQMFVEGSTFAGNTATKLGGGVAADDIGLLTLQNSTVTGNNAAAGGGISVGIDPMDDPETVRLRYATVAGNAAPVGANVATFEGTLDVGASVLVEPLVGATNCAGFPVSFVSQGRSFYSDGSCGAVGTDTVSGADPELGALGDNGGPTPTRLPAVTSPLLGAVPVAECAVGFDQRGVARPQGPNCEPGAVEVAEPIPISGTSGADLIVGTPRNDLLRGLGGNDRLLGLAGDDVLEGGDGDDVLIGGPGNDMLRGGAGRDVLNGSSGNDLLDGGPGLDRCFLGGGPPRDC